MKVKFLKFLLVFILFIESNIFIYPTDKFVFAQMKYPGNWDPYPFVYKDIINILMLTTSVKVEHERTIVDVTSINLEQELAKIPFIILLGDNEIEIPHRSLKILRNYVLNGGTIFIEDTSELYRSKFDESIRKYLNLMFPEYKLKKTTKDHVLMKSFYLITEVTGRVVMYPYLEFIEYENRPAVIYSRNNMISCWVRDRFGRFVYNCIPNGETQRFNSQKLFLNIIMYSLCGTYKMDKVHQPYIERKLKLKR